MPSRRCLLIGNHPLRVQRDLDLWPWMTLKGDTARTVTNRDILKFPYFGGCPQLYDHTVRSADLQYKIALGFASTTNESILALGRNRFHTDSNAKTPDDGEGEGQECATFIYNHFAHFCMAALVFTYTLADRVDQLGWQWKNELSVFSAKRTRNLQTVGGPTVG